VLVTRDGHEVLTAAAPKSIDDVEAVMRESTPKAKQRRAR
jgi:hypothetical protein